MGRHSSPAVGAGPMCLKISKEKAADIQVREVMGGWGSGLY